MWIDDIFEGKAEAGWKTILAYVTIAPAAIYWLLFRPAKAIITWFSKAPKAPKAAEGNNRAEVQPRNGGDEDEPPPYPGKEEGEEKNQEEEKHREDEFAVKKGPSERLLEQRRPDFTGTGPSGTVAAASVPHLLSRDYEITDFLMYRRGTLGLTNVAVLPWGYGDITDFAGGVIICTDPEKHLAWFVHDPKIQEVQSKYQVRFEFHLSEEKEVTLKGVVPENTTAFQYMSQAYFQFERPLQKADERFKTSQIMEALNQGVLGNDHAAQQRLSLLKCGGFFYHNGPWEVDKYTGERTRGIAGIRVFLPRNDKSKKTCLYFGQARSVTPHAGRFLTGGRHPESIVQEQAILNPITVPSLLDQGMSHYRWLAPEDLAIVAMQQSRGDSFGRYGVFLYRSKKDYNLDCMLPVVDKEESDAYIEGYKRQASAGR